MLTHRIKELYRFSAEIDFFLVVTNSFKKDSFQNNSYNQNFIASHCNLRIKLEVRPRLQLGFRPLPMRNKKILQQRINSENALMQKHEFTYNRNRTSKYTATEDNNYLAVFLKHRFALSYENIIEVEGVLAFDLCQLHDLLLAHRRQFIVIVLQANKLLQDEADDARARRITYQPHSPPRLQSTYPSNVNRDLFDNVSRVLG